MESRYAGAEAGDSPQRQTGLSSLSLGAPSYAAIWVPRSPSIAWLLRCASAAGSRQGIRLNRARNGSERSHRRVVVVAPESAGAPAARNRANPGAGAPGSGRHAQATLVAVGPADVPQDVKHLLGRGRAHLALARDRVDAPHRLLAPHRSQLDPGMPAGELGQDGDAQTAGHEPLDHLVVLGLEADLRFEARFAAEADHLVAAGTGQGAAEPVLIRQVGD